MHRFHTFKILDKPLLEALKILEDRLDVHRELKYYFIGIFRSVPKNLQEKTIKDDLEPLFNQLGIEINTFQCQIDFNIISLHLELNYYNRAYILRINSYNGGDLTTATLSNYKGNKQKINSWFDLCQKLK